jgi:hypothetical protein
MNGDDAILAALADSGFDACFASPALAKCICFRAGPRAARPSGPVPIRGRCDGRRGRTWPCGAQAAERIARRMAEQGAGLPVRNVTGKARESHRLRWAAGLRGRVSERG